MAAVIPVGANAVKISGTASKPYLISNDPNSQTVIYLGQDSSVSTNNYGVKLLPGGSLTWTEITREVWAISASTNTANITVLYEATATFSSQVSAVNANAPVLLNTTTYTFTGGTSGIVVNTTIPDIAIGNYASIKVMVSTNIVSPISPGPTSLDNGASISFIGLQTNTIPATFSTSITNRATWPFGDGLSVSTGLQAGIQTLEFPVVNSYLSGSYLAVTSGTTTPSGTITIRIFGQGKTLLNSIYTNFIPINNPPLVYNGYVAADGIMFNTTLSGATSSAYNIPSQNGIANILMSSGSTTLTRVGYTLFFYNYLLGGWYIAQKRLLAAPGTIGDSINDQIILPNVPIQFRIEATGVGTSIFTITQEV